MAPTVAAQPPMSTTQHSVDLFRSSASLYHGSLRSSELQIDLGCKWSPSTAFMRDRLLFGMMVRPIGSMYGIYTYIWLIYMVNVAKYTIHGYYGRRQGDTRRFVSNETTVVVPLLVLVAPFQQILPAVISLHKHNVLGKNINPKLLAKL